MIGSLTGELIARSGDLLVVDVSGVGYEVQVPSTTLGNVGPIGSSVRLWVHTRVREDAISLFGFASLEERSWFEQLLGVHGVGPALALAILGHFTPTTLAEAVRQGDVDGLTVVPGVGPKSAMRLIVELRSRLEDLEPVPLSGQGAEPSALAEARSALESLGYPSSEAAQALQAVVAVDGADDTASLVRGALRRLSRQRADSASRLGAEGSALGGPER
jgi:Holliday junction DNA helicase RuvA